MASEKNRGKWDSKGQFLLACIGYAVGLGNIWRFPYLCYVSGGGAFLIPYFIMLIFCGVPLLYMEMAVGQLTRKGPVHAMAMLCPLLKGTGVAMVVLSFLLCTYYNVIVAWALRYLFHSFSNPLPWKTCQNEWKTDQCWDPSNETTNGAQNSTEEIENYVDYMEYPMSLKRQSPSLQYFENNVLRMSDGLGAMGGLNGDLVGYLFLAWFICFCCIFKGVKSVGKVVYVTTIFPYVLLIILLVRSVTLPGAINGIRYFLIPNWSQLLEPRVWMLAAAQNFNSIGIGFGSLIAFSSYNRKDNNIYHDTLAIAIINSLTSLLAGFVVFSALGVIAETLQTSVDDAVTAGPELVFVVIPMLFIHLPGSNLWAVLFFVMLIFLGVDSQFGMVEVITTSIMDMFQHQLQNVKRSRQLVAFGVCFICFLLGLPYVCKEGIYFFTLIDNYAAVVPLMYVAYFEVMAVCWFFGANRLAREISFLSGIRPYYFFPFCWLFVSPVLITVMSNFTFRTFSAVGYGNYVFPAWAHVIGSFVSLSSVIWIPIGIIHTFCCTYTGTCKQRFGRSVTPTFVPHYMKKSDHTDEEIALPNTESAVHYSPTAAAEPLLIETTTATAPEIPEPEPSSPPPDYKSLNEALKSENAS